MQHPLFGGGLGTFLLGREIAGLPLVVIHSVPIWFMAEMGVVGLAAYLVFLATLVAYAVDALPRRESLASGLLIVVGAFILMGLVHDIFFQRTFWFACGLLLVDPARAAQRRDETQSTAMEGACVPGRTRADAIAGADGVRGESR